VGEPLIADTGGLLQALARRRDGSAYWPDYEAALRGASVVVVPALVLPEVDYLLREDRAAMRALIADLFDPASRYEYEHVSAQDLVRAIAIDAKFASLQLGLVDGAVAAVAERRGVSRVLTTDRRDFGAIRVGPRFDQALTLVP